MRFNPAWIEVVVSLIAVLLIPLITLAFRIAIRQSKVDDKLENIVSDVKELVVNKDKVHAELLEQMRLDRENADRRLRFMEEFWIHRGLSGENAEKKLNCVRATIRRAIWFSIAACDIYFDSPTDMYFDTFRLVMCGMTICISIRLAEKS